MSVNQSENTSDERKGANTPEGEPRSRRGGARPGAGRPVKRFAPVPAELSEAIRGADTFEELRRLNKKITLDLAEARIERPLALALLELVREQRQVLKAEGNGGGAFRVTGAAMLLTPGELAALNTYRASIAPPPIGANDSAALLRPMPYRASIAPPPIGANDSAALLRPMPGEAIREDIK